MNQIVSKNHSYLKVYLVIDSLKCSMDTGEFRSPVFQRVHQYLCRHVGCVPLDRFSYKLESVEGNPVECLQILLA